MIARVVATGMLWSLFLISVLYMSQVVIDVCRGHSLVSGNDYMMVAVYSMMLSALTVVIKTLKGEWYPFHHVVIILISYTTGFSSLPLMATFFGISPMTLAQSQLWFIGVCTPMVIGFLVPTLVLGKKRSAVEVGEYGSVNEAA